MSYSGVKIYGKIKPGMFNEKFELYFGEKQLTGSIKSKMFSDEYDFVYDNKKITGEIKIGINYIEYDFKFAGRFLKGKNIQGLINSDYILDTNIEDPKDIIIFLIIEINRIMNEENERDQNNM